MTSAKALTVLSEDVNRINFPTNSDDVSFLKSKINSSDKIHGAILSLDTSDYNSADEKEDENHPTTPQETRVKFIARRAGGMEGNGDKITNSSFLAMDIFKQSTQNSSEWTKISTR